MKKSLLVCLMVFCGLVANAVPKLPSKCEAFRPQALGALILSESEAQKLVKSTDFGQNTPPQSGFATYWTVYSDRDNNTTYESPSTTAAQCTTLSFNETLRIAQVKNGFALVYVEPKKTVTYPMISESAVCKGWVPMSKLLLWQSCLASDRGIYNKALLCVNLESQDLSKGVGRGYKEPSTKSQAYELTTDINFYFIMKKENGMALLATQSKMDGGFTDQVLFHWVPEQSYVPWNQRSCLEPTWKHEDVEYFASKDITAKVYKNKQFEGDVISHISYVKMASEKYQQYLYRMPGSSLRYPILDNGTEVVYNMSTFSSYGGEATGSGRKEKTPQEKADSIKVNRLKKMQNINLAIVIDGTSSMEPYYPAVKEAIKEGVQFFSKNYKIKIGAVIYRDYADGEQGLCEVMPMTSVENIARLNSFLDTGGKYGIKSSPKDVTQTEALFYGMNMALDTLRFNEGESNIMLVVGDCGNDANDTKCATKEQIIEKMVALNIHPMGFQVQNKSIVAYSSFNMQLNEIYRKSLAANYNKYSADIKMTPQLVRNANNGLEGLDFRANVEEQLYIGQHRYAIAEENNGKMDPSLLSVHMTSSISEFANTIQRQIDMVANTNKLSSTPGSFGAGGAKQGGNLNIADAFIREKLGAEWAEAMKKSGALMNFSGYVSKKDASGRSFFMPVIFISDEEFQDMLKRLAPVNEAAKAANTNDRTPYIEAMKALVRSLAPGISDADMAQMSNNDITKMIGGLNESAKSLQTYTLDQLSDQNAVPANVYMRIITDFNRKYGNLSRIKASKTYEYVKEFNSARYYWIPIENLP